MFECCTHGENTRTFTIGCLDYSTMMSSTIPTTISTVTFERLVQQYERCRLHEVELGKDLDEHMYLVAAASHLNVILVEFPNDQSRGQYTCI